MAARLVSVAVVLVAALAAAAGPSPDRTPPADATSLDTGWYAEMDTGHGRIVFRLLVDQAPQSVAHFAALAEGRLEWIDPFTGEPRTDPYYDGLEIHKVRAAQRFEFGDPTGTGRGAAPFYVPEEGKAPVTFDQPWRVGMTRASLGRISGSLFFVTAGAQPFLRNRHPCFGEVVRGQDVVREITTVKADASGHPREPIRVDRVRVFRVGDPEPLPEPIQYVPQPRRLEMAPELREAIERDR